MGGAGLPCNHELTAVAVLLPCRASVPAPGHRVDVTAAGVIVPAREPELAAPLAERPFGRTRSFTATPCHTSCRRRRSTCAGIYRWIETASTDLYDSFEGEHSRMFVPRRRDRQGFRRHGGCVRPPAA